MAHVQRFERRVVLERLCDGDEAAHVDVVVAQVEHAQRAVLLERLRQVRYAAADVVALEVQRQQVADARHVGQDPTRALRLEDADGFFLALRWRRVGAHLGSLGVRETTL